MFPTLLSFDRGAVRRATIALLGTLAIAACDTDRAVSPAPVASSLATPTTLESRGVPNPYGNLIIKTVDPLNNLIGSAQFKIMGPQLVVVTVTDNDANDSDPTFGKIKLANVKVGTYNVCEITAPAGFAIPSWACHSGTVTSGATLGIEPFVHEWLPYVQAGFDDKNGNHIGGGVMLVKDSTGTPISLVADNSPLDIIKVPGYFSILLPHSGTFSLCAAQMPPGWVLKPNQAPCFNFTVKNNGIINVGAFHIQPAVILVY